MMQDKHQKRFDRQVDRVERHAPKVLARVLAWLRRPYARLVRIPLGILFVCGGFLAFLPILGLWMLPLGLLLLAVDLPILRGPVGDWLVRLQRWLERSRRKNGKRS